MAFGTVDSGNCNAITGDNSTTNGLYYGSCANSLLNGFSNAQQTNGVVIADNSLSVGGYQFINGTDASGNALTVTSAGAGIKLNGGKITGLAAGTASTDATNVWQLKGLAAVFGGGATIDATGAIVAPSYALTKANAIGGTTGAAADVGTAFGKVDAALGALDTRVTNNANDITSLQTTVNNINNGTAGLVQQSAGGANLTVGKDTDGAAVDFTGTAGARKLVGVADGEISATSNDAINGSQLNATNQAVAQNTSDIAKLDTRLGTAESDIATLQTRADTTDAAVAKNTTDIAKNTSDIAALDTRMGTAETNIAQNTSDIADLQNRADQTDAAVAQNTADIAKNTSDITKNNSDISALDGRMGTAEGNISNLDSRVTNVEGSVDNLSQQINNGEVGLVKQDATTRAITVAADKDGSEVNFAGTQGARKLVGVAEGEVSATSQEAVNGAQLNATNDRVAANEAAIGGLDSRVTKNEGDIVNIDNRTTKNEGDIANLDQRQGKTEGDVSNLRSDVNGLDGRVTTVETSVAGLNEKLAQTSSDVITQSRSYTDSRVDSLHREMDDRFNVQDERIDRMGAMGSAMSMMTASLGGLHTQNRAAVGTGFVNGEKALSVGYQRAISDRANFTLGGAFTHDDRSIGGAVGLGW